MTSVQFTDQKQIVDVIKKEERCHQSIFGQRDMVYKFSEPQYVFNLRNLSHLLMYRSYRGVCSPPENASKEI